MPRPIKQSTKVRVCNAEKTPFLDAYLRTAILLFEPRKLGIVALDRFARRFAK